MLLANRVASAACTSFLTTTTFFSPIVRVAYSLPLATGVNLLTSVAGRDSILSTISTIFTGYVYPGVMGALGVFWIVKGEQIPIYTPSPKLGVLGKFYWKHFNRYTWIGRLMCYVRSYFSLWFTRPKLALFYTSSASFFLVAIALNLQAFPYRYYYSTMMNTLNVIKVPPNVTKSRINTFRSLDFASVAPPPIKGGHSHEALAGSRSAAINLCNFYAAQIGLKPFSVQRSSFDQNRGVDGTREYFWARDAHLVPAWDEFTDHHLRLIIDVDYYIDMNEMLTHAAPTLLYTFAPTAVARETSEYSFNFDKDNTLHMIASGGAKYSHPIWNYNKDHITVKSYAFGIFPTSSVTYQIDRHQVGLDRDLTLLTPLVEYGFLGTLLSYFISSEPLTRLKVNHGAFNRLAIRTQNKHMISTAYCEDDQYSSATIPISHDNYFRNVAKIQVTTIAPYTIQSFLNYAKEDTQKAQSEAAILVGYHASRLTMPYAYQTLSLFLPRSVIHTLYPNMSYPLQTVYPVNYGTRLYQFGSELPTPGMLEPFMTPLFAEAYVPMKGKSNEQAAVDGRIEKVKCPTMEITPIIKSTIVEFVEFLLPNPHQLHPTGQDVVFERQDRPSQRSILMTALYLPLAHVKRKCMEFFIKSESYSKPADPRIISTMNPTTKIVASEYMYAFADYFIKTEFYAFGKTPEEISTKVSSICQASSSVSLSDFSRMDGHISNVLRELDNAVMYRAFAPEHHDKIKSMLDSLVDLSAVGKFGTRFNTGTAQCSGDPFTAVFNSLRNAFIHYRARRAMKRGNVFYTPQESWDWLQTQVLVGGDDGIAGDMLEQPLNNACKAVGQVLEYESVQRGSLGVNFLSRFYTTEVWFGNISSCCDIKRQLIKFHLSVKLPPDVSRVQKLVEKSRSFAMTDSNTPIIGPLVTKVMNLVSSVPGYNDPSAVAVRNLQSWLSTQGPVPNSYHTNFHDYLHSAIPESVTFEANFLAWLNNVSTLEEILEAPLMRLPPPPTPHPTAAVVVDSWILPPQQQEPEAPHPSSPDSTPTFKEVVDDEGEEALMICSGPYPEGTIFTFHKSRDGKVYRLANLPSNVPIASTPPTTTPSSPTPSITQERKPLPPPPRVSPLPPPTTDVPTPDGPKFVFGLPDNKVNVKRVHDPPVNTPTTTKKKKTRHRSSMKKKGLEISVIPKPGSADSKA